MQPLPAPPPPRSGVASFGDSINAAAAVAATVLPRVLAFVAILVVGWFLAKALASAVAALLRKIKFNEHAQRSGFSGFVTNMGVQTDAAGFVAGVAKWAVRLLALVVAFDALGLTAVSTVLQELLLWLPNLVVALVILVVGGLAANALANLVRGATAGADVDNPALFANLARAAVWGFAIVVAVNQLGVAQALVNTLFMGVVGALALALGLAFGLGGRDTAARLLERWTTPLEQPHPLVRPDGSPAPPAPPPAAPPPASPPVGAQTLVHPSGAPSPYAPPGAHAGGASTPVPPDVGLPPD